jgi:hypothetical protein
LLHSHSPVALAGRCLTTPHRLKRTRVDGPRCGTKKSARPKARAAVKLILAA